MPMSPRQESALIVEIPDIESTVATFRKAHDPVAIRGIPAHVTVLYPFKQPNELTNEILDEVEQIVSRHDAFDVVFTTVQAFSNVVWLGPEPAIPFKRITQHLVDRYPSCPPYEGKHADSIPHLTVAHATPGVGIPELERLANLALAGRLPISGRARAVSLYVSETDTDWRRIRVFPLRDMLTER
jgi:2'-5' RNA ligase